MMKQLLEMALKLKGLTIESKAVTVLRQCDRQIVSTALRPLIDDYDIILSMACGIVYKQLGKL